MKPSLTWLRRLPESSDSILKYVREEERLLSELDQINATLAELRKRALREVRAEWTLEEIQLAKK